MGASHVYRPEIDGLRTVAVVPVILFHAGLSAFAGGFIGVDIFFVISGYLITGIIHREIQEGRFSIARFYERRVRRIFPALFTVMLACIPFAWAWMTPGELESFSRSLVAVPAFIANVLFWQESGYFGEAAELKPLLHTWSLAVEEQFYVFFPLLLLLLRRYSLFFIAFTVSLVSLISIFISEWGVRNYPDAAFYLLPTRAWELGVGAVVALTQGYWSRTSKGAASLLSLAGLLTIVVCILSYDKSVSFPGLWALPPVVGTALVIAYGRTGTFTANLLSWRPMVGIGLLSYSAYLWHQPLFAFARIRLYEGVPPIVFGALILATFLLAYMSWRYVERSFRGTHSMSRRQIFTGAGIASVALVAFGLVGHVLEGVSGRLPSNLRDIDQRIAANVGLNRACEYRGDFKPVPECSVGSEPSLVLWGDSYAMHLVDGLRSANPDLQFVQATRSKCGPFHDIAPTNSQYPAVWADSCLAFNRSVVQYIAATDSVTDVVMSSPFDQYTSGEYDYWTKDGVAPANLDHAVRAFVRTADELRALGKRVWVVSPPARNGSNLGLCLARSAQYGEDADACNFAVADYEEERRGVIQFLTAVEQAGVPVVWLPEWTCRGSKCLASIDGTFIYRDQGHLSREGSRWIGEHTPALVFPKVEQGEHRASL